MNADERELDEFEAIRELIAVAAKHKRVIDERQRRRELTNQQAATFLEGTLATVLSRRCAQIVGGTWFVGKSRQSDRHAGVVAVPVQGEGASFAYVISAIVTRDGSLKIKRLVGTGESFADFQPEDEIEYPPAVKHGYDLSAISGAEIVRDFTLALDVHLRRRLATNKKGANRSTGSTATLSIRSNGLHPDPWSNANLPHTDD